MKRCAATVLALMFAALFTECAGASPILPGTLGVTLTDSTILEHWDGTQYWKAELSQKTAAVYDRVTCPLYCGESDT